ncbi:MAG: cation diffusion facilitator family transporter [Promethearchaeota archaeon]
MVFVLSVILVLSVFIIKLVQVFFTNSLSFFAELTDGIMDFLIVGITFLALRMSRKPADHDHMFGHYKVNSFAAIIQSLITVVVYIYIIYLSGQTLANIAQYQIINSAWAAFSLFLIAVINFSITRFIKKVAEKTNNASIKAQTVNFKGDFFRNIAIIVGLIFAVFGIYILDPILAIIFSIKAIFESVTVFRQGFNELMDYNAINPGEIRDLEEKIGNTNGVAHLDNFAIRTAGFLLEANVQITLDDKISLDSAYEINTLIKENIRDKFSEYRCNSIIQVNSSSSDLRATSSLSSSLSSTFYGLLEKVIKMGSNIEKIDEIHRLSLDIMNDNVVLQFHILMDPKMNLNDAHNIASEIEQEIKVEITKRLENIESQPNIRIISHIEPSEIAKQVYFTNNIENTFPFYRKLIEHQIRSMPEINDFHKIVIFEEDGIYISLHIKINGELSVRNAHRISQKLEFYLKSKIPNLKRCVIHSEPIP